MSVLRERRLPNLTLPLPPHPPTAPATSDCRRCFSLPSVSAPATTSNSEYRLIDFDKIAVLGHGNGGTVYKALHRKSNSLFAIKLLHGDSSTSSPEAKILLLAGNGDSPYVIRCFATFPSSASGSHALLLEVADGGSLASLLARSGPVPEPALSSIARQALLGLAHLHSLRIVHRDLKPSNLLLTAAGDLKIADFGVGKILRRSLDPCASYVGTAAYMSPERFDPERYGGDYDPYAADVWSLGVAILELHLGHFPLLPAGQRPDWAALMFAICFGEPPPPPESASEDLKGFVAACLQKESGKRATVDELLKHPFVAARDASESKKALADLIKPPPTREMEP